jgi:hypothetical protein
MQRVVAKPAAALMLVFSVVLRGVERLRRVLSLSTITLDGIAVHAAWKVAKGEEFIDKAAQSAPH